MTKRGSILYIDRDKEIREMIYETMEQDFNLHTLASLHEAESFLRSKEITGMLIDGMFKQEELLDFVGKAKAKAPNLSIAVLIPVVDMVLEPEFKKALEELGVKVVGKTDVFSPQEKIRALFSWSCEQHGRGEA